MTANTLYTTGGIARRLRIKRARAAYIMRALVEEKKIVPVMDTGTAKLYDEEAVKLAAEKNKEVR